MPAHGPRGNPHKLPTKKVKKVKNKGKTKKR